MDDIIILGASGHAKVIIDALHCRNKEKKTYQNIFLLDDNESLIGQTILGHRVMGKISDCEKYAADRFVIGIGNNRIRKMIAEQYQLNYISVVHPSAVISEDADIAEGTVVMAGAVINPGVRIGKHCIINTAVTVDHDCWLEDYVHLSPGAHLSGTVHIGEETWLGTGSNVKNNLDITDRVIIGVGGVVVKNIQAEGIYVGVPVKSVNLNE